MKNKIISSLGCFLGILVISLSSCTKMDHFYKDYVIERTYTGKPDTVWARPGNQRVMIEFVTPKDPSAKTFSIKWGENDSLAIPIDHSKEKNNFIIENLVKPNYLFSIFTLDDKGNRSLPIEISSNVYGPAFASTMRDRVINNVFSVKESVGLVLKSSLLLPETFVGTEFEFFNLAGDKKVELIKKAQIGGFVQNLDLTKQVRTRSVYLPQANAFEFFYTEWEDLDASLIMATNTLTFSSTSYTDGIYVDFHWQRGFLEAEVPEPTGLDIDLAYALGAGSRGNLFAMDGTGFGAFSSTWQAAIDAWPHQNEGNMKLLKGATALSLYDGLSDGNYDQIKAAYEGSTVAATKRLQSLAVNDIILLHSVERNLFVAIKVAGTPPAVSGALGDFVIDFKVGRP